MIQYSVPIAPAGSNWGGQSNVAAAQNVGRAVTRNLATQQGQAYGQRFDQRAGAKERRAANAPVQGPRLRNFAGQRQAPSMLQNSVSTGIRPELLYSQQHMQRMANRDFGQAMAQADPRLAQKQFMGRGLSLDAGTLAAATPQIAEGRMGALMARNVKPLQDQLANQQFLLQGQQAQGNEFIGLGNLLRQQQQNAYQQQQQAINPLLQMAMGY